jgi:hypothetical protein
LPAWLAVMLQVPTPIRATMLPETVHTPVVVLVNVMDKPLLALALKANGDVPIGSLAKVPKVMVWLAAATLKVCVVLAAL